MPAGIDYPPPMGGANPQNLQALAAAGDPRAIAMLQQMQGGAGGGAPQGMPPGGPGGGMPPQQGMPPMGAMPPAGGMTQSEFGNGGGQPPADVQARRAAMLIQMLRARGDK
jgi:hypothetical protein